MGDGSRQYNTQVKMPEEKGPCKLYNVEVMRGSRKVVRVQSPRQSKLPHLNLSTITHRGSRILSISRLLLLLLLLNLGLDLSLSLSLLHLRMRQLRV